MQEIICLNINLFLEVKFLVSRELIKMKLGKIKPIERVGLIKLQNLPETYMNIKNIQRL